MANRYEMLAHAVQADPMECCGLLLGTGSQVETVRRLTNIDERPNRYQPDPGDLYQAVTEAEEQGLGVLAVYHSHPEGRAYPSGTDVALAPGETWPDVLQVIVSLRDTPRIRAFTIKGEEVEEVPLSDG